MMSGWMASKCAEVEINNHYAPVFQVKTAQTALLTSTFPASLQTPGKYIVCTKKFVGKYSATQQPHAWLFLTTGCFLS